MLSLELLKATYYRIPSRRLKAYVLTLMRLLGMRYLVVRMDTTNLCNLRCRMCYYSALEPRARQEMDTKLFSKIAAEVFPKTRFLYLSCGTEPLMNKHFAEFLKIAAKHRVPFTSFCTNGMLLSEEVIETSIKTRLSEVVFSIDGATQKTFEFIRRGAKWNVLLENLDLLQARKAHYGSLLPKARINFTCMAENIQELADIVSLAHEHGVRNVHVRHLLPFRNERVAGIACKEQMKYQESFNAMAGEGMRRSHELGVKLFLPEQVSMPLVGSSAPADRSCGGKREANPDCVIPWYAMMIKPNGDYELCATFRPFGNLGQNTFAEIFGSAKMLEVRRKLLRRAADSCSWECGREAYRAARERETTEG